MCYLNRDLLVPKIKLPKFGKKNVILLPLMWLHLGFISVIIYWVLKLLGNCFHLLSPLFEYSTNYEFPIQILLTKYHLKVGKFHKIFSIWAHSQKNEPHYCPSSFPHKVKSWETRIWLIFWEWYQIRSIFWDYTSFTEWGVPIHFLKTYPISQWGVHFANIIRTLICFR